MKELNVFIQLDQDVPAEAMLEARRAALETFILRLWQGGHVSTRQAASQLGLSYYDYLDLLHARGLPACNANMVREEVIQEAAALMRAAQKQA